MQQRRSIQGGAARPARTAIMPVIVSILLIIALVAASALSGNRILPVQSLSADAPEVYTTSESFASGANVTVDDAAIRTQGGEDQVLEDGARQERPCASAISARASGSVS